MTLGHGGTLSSLVPVRQRRRGGSSACAIRRDRRLARDGLPNSRRLCRLRDCAAGTDDSRRHSSGRRGAPAARAPATRRRHPRPQARGPVAAPVDRFRRMRRLPFRAGSPSSTTLTGVRVAAGCSTRPTTTAISTITSGAGVGHADIDAIWGCCEAYTIGARIRRVPPLRTRSRPEAFYIAFRGQTVAQVRQMVAPAARPNPCSRKPLAHRLRPDPWSRSPAAPPTRTDRQCRRRRSGRPWPRRASHGW